MKTTTMEEKTQVLSGAGWRLSSSANWSCSATTGQWEKCRSEFLNTQTCRDEGSWPAAQGGNGARRRAGEIVRQEEKKRKKKREKLAAEAEKWKHVRVANLQFCLLLIRNVETKTAHQKKNKNFFLF